jgi:hypothetical protein
MPELVARGAPAHHAVEARIPALARGIRDVDQSKRIRERQSEHPRVRIRFGRFARNELDDKAGRAERISR